MRSLVATCLALAAAACGSPARQPVSLVVTGGTVITENAARRIIPSGAVAIDGNRIVAVDTVNAVAATYAPRETIDATGQVVMPGLINTHTHAAMVLFRGLADDLPLDTWLQKYIFPAEAKTVSPEMVRIGTRLGALEMIESGTTTFVDMYCFEEEVAKAAREAGLRGILGQTIIGFPVPDAATPADGLKHAETFLQDFRNDPLETPAVAPHAIYTNDQKTLEAASALARRYGAPLIIHLAETEDNVKTSLEQHRLTPVAYLDSIGFWAPRTIIAHGVWVTDADIAILKRNGVSVSHNPESNMKLASGAAPVTKYLKAGVALGLGTDGAASNNDLDMFEAMRQAAFMAKLVDRDPAAVPATAALDMATIGGARAIGMADEIGSLEPGKRADLITVSMSAARQTPLYDPVSDLVYVTRGDDVRDTVVDGQVLMLNRHVLTLDANAVRGDAIRFSQKVRAAVGK